MLLKSVIFTLFTLFPFSMFATSLSAREAEYANALLNTTLQIMQECYIKKHKRDVGLSECMLEVFNKIPNPQYYRVNINGDTPGDLNLLLYGPTGYTINCSLTLKEKITVNNCLSYDLIPLNNNQEISITPPFK